MSAASSSRYILLPVPESQLPIWDMNKLQQHLYWVPEEISLEEDKRQWEHLPPKEKRFVSLVLAFFASADLLICENLEINFSQEVQWNSVKAFYKGQDNMEMIHAEVYANLLNTLVPSATERDHLINSFETIPSVKAKHDWVHLYMDSTSKTFPQRLVAFCVFEGLLFSASFAAIYFFKHERKGLLPGLCHANELISRDEGLHASFAALLYNKYVVSDSTIVSESISKLSNAEAHKIVQSAVDVERLFVRDAIPVGMLGMNASLMERYVEFVANKILRCLGHPHLYPSVKNPFLWMESLSIPGQSNFFERRVSEYVKPVQSSPSCLDFTSLEF